MNIFDFIICGINIATITISIIAIVTARKIEGK